jgi:phosphoglycolate phosphatase-like HAD superfamily hydrolase
MLIIFDVDGTLLDGEVHDWASFHRALKTELGFVPEPGFFGSLADVTGESIVGAAMQVVGRAPAQSYAAKVQGSYLQFLTECYAADPRAFPVRPNAPLLLNHLTSMPGFTVALATGDWRPTISFKLRCAGFDVSRFPIATASDAPRRTEIIRLAAAKAGRSIADAIYVGDGVWDLRACRELGIPFIGTGNKIQRLLDAGAEHICEGLEIELFAEVLRRIGEKTCSEVER